MRECLGKVAQRVSRLRVDLLSEEAEVAGISERLGKGAVGLLQAPASPGKELDNPEATHRKSSLAALETLLVAIEQPRPRAQPLLKPPVRLLHPPGGRRLKAVKCQEEYRGVERVPIED